MFKKNLFGESADHTTAIIIILVVIILLIIFFLTQKKKPVTIQETIKDPRSFVANICKADGSIFTVRIDKNKSEEPIENFYKRTLTYVTPGYTDEVHMYNPPDINNFTFNRPLNCNTTKA